MKRYLIVFLSLILLQTITLTAQTEFSEANVKSVLIKLLEFSNNKDYAKANPIIAYRGEDIERDMKDNFNLDDKAEFNKLKRICNQIYALLKISEYEIGEFSKTTIEENTFYIYEVEFKSNKQSILKEFVFIPRNRRLLLVEMK